MKCVTFELRGEKHSRVYTHVEKYECIGKDSRILALYFTSGQELFFNGWEHISAEEMQPEVS